MAEKTKKEKEDEVRKKLLGKGLAEKAADAMIRRRKEMKKLLEQLK